VFLFFDKLVLLDFTRFLLFIFLFRSGKDPFIRLILSLSLSLSLCPSQRRKRSSFSMVETMEKNHGWVGN
jgi:hypothetical protein